MWQKGSVDNVHTFGLGLGRTSVELARIAYVFWSSQRLQGLECGSSPTSGTADPLARGDFCFNVWTRVPLTQVQVFVASWWSVQVCGCREVSWLQTLSLMG
jgi:hypothetical protein